MYGEQSKHDCKCCPLGERDAASDAHHAWVQIGDHPELAAELEILHDVKGTGHHDCNLRKQRQDRLGDVSISKKPQSQAVKEDKQEIHPGVPIHDLYVVAPVALIKDGLHSLWSICQFQSGNRTLKFAEDSVFNFKLLHLNTHGNNPGYVDQNDDSQGALYSRIRCYVVHLVLTQSDFRLSPEDRFRFRTTFLTETSRARRLVPL